MKSAHPFLIGLGAVIISTIGFRAPASLLPLSTADQAATSDAICRGVVLDSAGFRGSDGLIYTRTTVLVSEVLKGVFPQQVAIEHRGGQVGNNDELYSLSPRFAPGSEYLLYLTRNPDGKLQCTQGFAGAIRLVPLEYSTGFINYETPGQEALDESRALAAAGLIGSGQDVTDQAVYGPIVAQITTGMLGGVNTRFLQPDRGEPIPVLIDAASLPAGISLTQATNAVQQALNAWTAVTSLKFKIESVAPFGQGADTITTADEKLRIQLHDTYNRINTANVLGIGGRNGTSLPTPSGWNLGGNVNGNEFFKTTYGYVVLEAGNASMQNLSTFTEVICHEIGHAINMAHSSENPSESNTTLRQAMMYYQAHADGRGATLGAYDPPVIQQCYPSNTAPYTFNRVIDATTAQAAINISGINDVELRGYDLQTASLGLAVDGATSFNGSFSQSGNVMKYTPAGYYSDTSRYDPDVSSGSYSYRDLFYARFSDGTNASPYSLVRVLSFRGEATASPDGIPDYWMINYFGSATPSAGNQSQATDDADGDGLNTRTEYRTGTNPKDANSAVKITAFTGDTMQFLAQGYEVYEILGSTNFTDWQVVRVVSPGIASATFRTSLPQTNITATVSNLPTDGGFKFYRVAKVP